jgi:hypothetical protein
LTSATAHWPLRRELFEFLSHHYEQGFVAVEMSSTPVLAAMEGEPPGNRDRAAAIM